MVWLYICALSVLNQTNDIFHVSHRYLGSSLCSNICLLRLGRKVNDLLQTSHLNWCPSLFIHRWCCVILLLKTNLFFTHITAMWTVLTLYASIDLQVKMFLQVTLIGVEFITHATRERKLSNMQALMFLQFTLIIEWLITHITWVLRLLFVCAPVTAECSTKSKWFVTHVTCVLIPYSMYCLWFS